MQKTNIYKGFFAWLFFWSEFKQRREVFCYWSEIASTTHQEARVCAHNLYTCQVNTSRALGIYLLSGIQCIQLCFICFVFWFSFCLLTLNTILCNEVCCINFILCSQNHIHSANCNGGREKNNPKCKCFMYVFCLI